MAPLPALRRLSPLLAAGIAALTVLAAGPAHADDDRRLRPSTPLPAYTQECGSCHVAFPPALLPAESWQRLMKNLPTHFGTDASLDAATAAPITAWLLAQAGQARRTPAAPPEDRITRGRWFVREHREVTPATWTRPAVKGPANCAACHPQADQGDFNEHRIRIPR